jgi:hypothetical protein
VTTERENNIFGHEVRIYAAAGKFAAVVGRMPGKRSFTSTFT